LEDKNLPATHSFLSTDNDSVVLSSLKQAEDGAGVVARFYEVEGKPGRLVVSFNGEAQVSQSLNLLEESLPKDARGVSPFEIKTLRLLAHPSGRADSLAPNR